MIERVNKKETAVLIGLITPEQPVEKLNEYLDELEFLADTAGADVRKRFVQRLPYPDPRTFVGKGKLKEVFDYVVENAIDLIILCSI